MLNLVFTTLVAVVLGIFDNSSTKLEKLQLLAWQDAPIFTLPPSSFAETQTQLDRYLQSLITQGIDRQTQAVWIESDWGKLASYQENVPLSAASLSKIATTLASLAKWGADYRFETQIYGTGKIANGTLNGDLIVSGSGDPLFVWEEAIAMGNALNRQGIRKVTGNLIVLGDFYMNFQSDRQKAGELYKQAINVNLWSSAVKQQYQQMPVNTPRPQIAIAGNVQTTDNLANTAQLLLRHQSLKLAEILRQMNIYSNNEMAEMLAKSVGGAEVVAKIASKAANVSQSEIQLVNGSGLAVENRISARAVTAMLRSIDRQFKSQSLQVTDLFPVAGRDKVGTMIDRQIPTGTTIKTGTLNQVSALSGVITTRDRGRIWFTIINHGSKIAEFRQQQDRFLQQLSQNWNLLPLVINVNSDSQPYLGDPNRNFPG